MSNEAPSVWPEHLTTEELEVLGWVTREIPKRDWLILPETGQDSDKAPLNEYKAQHEDVRRIGLVQYATLVAISNLKSGAYASEIEKWLEKYTGQDDKSQTYVTLRRLVKADLITSEESPPRKVKGKNDGRGATKKYSLTNNGEILLNAVTAHIKQLMRLKREL